MIVYYRSKKFCRLRDNACDFALGTINLLRDKPFIRDFRVRDTGVFYKSYIKVKRPGPSSHFETSVVFDILVLEIQKFTCICYVYEPIKQTCTKIKLNYWKGTYCAYMHMHFRNILYLSLQNATQRSPLLFIQLQTKVETFIRWTYYNNIQSTPLFTWRY